MKAINFITHSFTLIICFLLIIISGEHLGGFYLLYILLGLPYGAIHAVLGVAGIFILIFNNYKFKRNADFLIERILNITAAIALILSISLFFINDKDQYNYSTFYQTVPMITIGIFGLVAVAFITGNLIQIFRKMAK